MKSINKYVQTNKIENIEIPYQHETFMAAYLGNSRHVTCHTLEHTPLLSTGHQKLAELGVSANRQEQVGVERERRRFEPEHRGGLAGERAIDSAASCVSVHHEKVSVGGVCVLRHELPRYDGTGLHVEDDACVDAAVVVRQQAGGENVFRAVNGDSREGTNSSGQPTTMLKRGGRAGKAPKTIVNINDRVFKKRVTILHGNQQSQQTKSEQNNPWVQNGFTKKKHPLHE